MPIKWQWLVLPETSKTCVPCLSQVTLSPPIFLSSRSITFLLPETKPMSGETVFGNSEWYNRWLVLENGTCDIGFWNQINVLQQSLVNAGTGVDRMYVRSCLCWFVLIVHARSTPVPGTRNLCHTRHFPVTYAGNSRLVTGYVTRRLSLIWPRFILSRRNSNRILK